MGGKSSGKSTTTNNQYDNRIAATDQAIVIAGGSSITMTDPGLVDFAKEALSSNENLLEKLLDGVNAFGINALKTVSDNADKSFDFVDKRLQNEEERTARALIPWVVAGGSIVAISYAMRK